VRRQSHRTPEVSVKLTRLNIEQKNPHPWKGFIFVARGVNPGRDQPWDNVEKKSQPRRGDIFVSHGVDPGGINHGSHCAVQD